MASTMYVFADGAVVGTVRAYSLPGALARIVRRDHRRAGVVTLGVGHDPGAPSLTARRLVPPDDAPEPPCSSERRRNHEWLFSSHSSGEYEEQCPHCDHRRITSFAPLAEVRYARSAESP